MQPVTHPGQGSLGEVEIPERGEIGNPGFVPQIVEERAVRLQSPDVADQARAHCFEPIPVGKAGFANQGGGLERIFPIAFLSFEETPIDRPVARPPVIGRVEIGRDVFEVEAQIGVEQGLDPLRHKIV